jgi:D-alanyl-D-alanine carboxypeptidase/D-alanyl-D-alanine-endopeptidase (penicillin-binding protein 4)
MDTMTRTKDSLMKRFFQLITSTLLLCTLIIPGWAQTPQQQELDQMLDKMMKKMGTNVNIGVKVEDMATGKIIYARNAERSYLPASNQKIFTAAAALAVLGTEFTFKTQLLTETPTLQNGVLLGNLYVRFSGDPELQNTHISTLLKQLKDQGLRSIKGNVYLDNTAFEPQLIGDGWMWDDTQYCYAPPISANMLNQNCLQFYVKPGKKAGQPLQIQTNQTNKYLALKNTTQTRASGTRGCQIKLQDVYQNQYQITGCLPVTSKGAGMSVALTDPNPYATAIIKGLLRDNKITVSGQIIQGPALKPPAKLVVIAERQSSPMSKLLRTMMKHSDNVIAETIFKTVGGTYFNSPGSWERGAKAVKALFGKSAKINFENAVVADGSGLSRYNLITPSQIVQLLDYIYHNPQLSQQFMTTLPIGGIDGSLKYRMQTPGVRGNVWAKTGTMANVVALSGYIKTSQKKMLAFSIIINGASGSLQKYRKIQDNICEYLVKQY